MNIIPIRYINDAAAQDTKKLIRESEAFYANQLTACAKQISERCEEKPILLLSGPSGSGKTTSALRIQALLEDWNCHSMVLSMDNYYLPADQTPQALTADGKVDYESPYRLDIPLLSEHLERLARCEEIHLPVFNFAEQKREQGRVLRREPGTLMILEGIHALNPEVTGSAGDYASCIYVSVRTRLKKEDGSLLHPSKIRLMRRLIRDQLYRGRKPLDTLAMFESVSAGEEKYILPYKHRAEYEIDTMLSYEASAYRPHLLEALRREYDGTEQTAYFGEILSFLEELAPIKESDVPDRSLVREFIGGSTFTY